MIVQGTFDPETLAEFNRRVQDYAALRSRLEVGLPPLVVTTNADEIETFEHRLAERIRHARGSRRGQMFLPAMEGQLKRMLAARADAGDHRGDHGRRPGRVRHRHERDVLEETRRSRRCRRTSSCCCPTCRQTSSTDSLDVI